MLSLEPGLLRHRAVVFIKGEGLLVAGDLGRPYRRAWLNE